MIIQLSMLAKKGCEVVCGSLGLLSGYGIAAAILPNHSQPLIEQEQRTRALMEETKEDIRKIDEWQKKLEEEGVWYEKEWEDK